MIDCESNALPVAPPRHLAMGVDKMNESLLSRTMGASLLKKVENDVSGRGTKVVGKFVKKNKFHNYGQFLIKRQIC